MWVAWAVPAAAEEVLLPMTDTATYFAPALGKQVNVRFSASFASSHLDKADLDQLVISELPDAKVCFFGQEHGIDTESPKLK